MSRKEKKVSAPLWVFILTGLIIILIVPGLLAVFMEFQLFGLALGGADGWLSYWGGYLGGIIGLIAVVLTTKFLISNQNKQHRELLEQQKIDIQTAADLNDKKERERVYQSFLVRQNEEVIEILIKLRGIIQGRVNLLLSIKHVYNDTQKLTNLIQNHAVGLEKEILLSMNSKILERMTELDMLKNEETQIKTLLIEKLAEITLRVIYIELGMEKLQTFKENQEVSLTVLSQFVNENNFDKVFDAELDLYAQQKNKDLNELLDLYTDNLKSMMRQFK